MVRYCLLASVIVLGGPTLACVVQQGVAGDRSAAPPGGHDGATDLQGFLTEYGAALRKIGDYFSEITVSGTLSDVVKKPRRRETRDVAKMLFQRGVGASKYERSSDGQAVVWCRNPGSYVFKLSQHAASDEFSLSELHTKSLPISDSRERYAYRCLDASHAVTGIDVREILAAPGFRLKSVQREQGEGEQIVHVSYDYTPEDGITMLRDGELWLSREKGLAIVKSRSAIQLPKDPSVPIGSAVTEVEYGGMDDGVAIPKRVVIQHVLAGLDRREEFVFESVQHGRPDQAVFTLGHYGLPEADPSDARLVDASATGSVRVWLLCANVAVVGLLAFLLIARRRRRRRARSPLPGI